jgi:hypothetical protein
MVPPGVLDESFMARYYHLLPRLNMNTMIMVDWIWLPWEFQGLGLPNMGIEKAMAIVQYAVRQ